MHCMRTVSVQRYARHASWMRDAARDVGCERTKRDTGVGTARACGVRSINGNPMTRVHVSHTVRSSHLGVWIDIGHAAAFLLPLCWTCRRADLGSVQSNPSRAWSSSEFFVRFFGTNQTALDSTRHRTIYGPRNAGIAGEIPLTRGSEA